MSKVMESVQSSAQNLYAVLSYQLGRQQPIGCCHCRPGWGLPKRPKSPWPQEEEDGSR